MDLALAFELIHTATLIHDDIGDAAKLRRGVTTLHERIGRPKAMLAIGYLSRIWFEWPIYQACIDLIRGNC